MHRLTQTSLTARLLIVAAIVVVAVGTVFVVMHDGFAKTAVGDLTQLVLSAGAATAAFLAAGRSVGRLRVCWRWIGVGVGGWSVGQAIWCYYELVTDRTTPFPSMADAGFLVFPVALTIGLLLFPNDDPPGLRLRNILDGCVVVGALTTISGIVVLETIFTESTDESILANAVSLAYPLGDVLIVSMVFYGLSRPGPYQPTRILLACGTLAMAASDTPFLYYTAKDSYQTGSPFDLGWVAAFLLFGVAAIQGADARPLPRSTDNESGTPAPSAWPYVPLLLAAVFVAVTYLNGKPLSQLVVGSLSFAVAALLGRQYLTVKDNHRLLKKIKSGEDELRQQATMDLLTGLTNRALFNDRVGHALELHRRDMRPLAIMFCDLDDFKAVNDTFGHPAGDELLIRVSDRLRGALRTGDTLARFGGDEFAILIEDGGESTSVGARIIEALQPPFTINGTQLSIRVSVGMIELRPDEPSPTLETLLNQADIAMYSAKRSGKGRLAMWEPSMMNSGVLELPLQRPLSVAVANGDIGVAYQPVVSLTTGQVLGVEALARWNYDGVDVPPGQFVPLAVRSGLIGPLTSLMLEHACSDLAGWTNRTDGPAIQVAVNVPASLIADPDFPARIAEVTGRYGLAPSQLILELTEDALHGDLSTITSVTQELSTMGVPLSLDNFGTGHSSLVHLQQIPLGTLKIAMGFVADIDRDPRAERLVHALLGLARDLGVNIIAEGVERAEQADVLRELGCPMAQGHYFCPPVSAGELEQLLRQQTVGQPSVL